MNFLVFDIETSPTEDERILDAIRSNPLNLQPKPRESRKRQELWNQLSDEEKIQFHINKTATGNHAMVSHATFIETAGPGQPKSTVRCSRWKYESYQEFLGKLSDYFEEYSDSDTTWIGHNIKTFDIPMMLLQWAKNRLEKPSWFPATLGKFATVGKVYDTMVDAPTPGRQPFTSLVDACFAYGVHPPKEGASVGVFEEPLPLKLYRTGKYEELEEYCFDDVRATFELASRSTYNFSTLGA